jgi:ABC-2 type transport system ATP-binding protein
MIDSIGSEDVPRAYHQMLAGAERSAPVLEAAAITHSYGRKLVLNRVSLSIRAGEVVGIVGENGAGKSTLMRICAGLIRPDHGAVHVDGRVGYCPQIPGLFDLLNADEHLLLLGPALELSEAAVLEQGRALLGELGFPVGDASPTRYLSGGARQKLNLALALLGGVSVLLLDEPYQGFDHGAYVSFWEHVSSWSARGLGVVVITHLLTDLALVDRVVELTVPRPPELEATKP